MKNIFLSILIAISFMETAFAGEYYYFYDHLGDVDVVTDETGEAVATYEYDPFGNTIEENIYDEDFENDYKYTGQEEDDETGLYYYNARYYSPGLGRFMSQDPAVYDGRLFELLADPQSLNPYAYARNNPVKYVDPSGETSAVVFYGENYGDGSNSSDFQKKAETRISELASMVDGYGNVMYDDGVYAIDGSTFDQWQNALNTYEDIGLIEYYGHGDNEAIYLRSAGLFYSYGSALESIFSNSYQGELDYYSDGSRDHYVSELFTGNTSDNLNIHLWSCNASVGVGSVAQSFANHFNSSVYAANTFVNFNGDKPFIRWYRRIFNDGKFDWIYQEE